MKSLDSLTERLSRAIAQRSSRRGAIAAIGKLLCGSSLLPLLPVARAADGDSGTDPNAGKQPTRSTGNPQDPGDPGMCTYWRYCAIDGSLCSCCGGSVSKCPAGTEMSPITWIGTCLNPADKRQYIISYNDCCGGASCARCACHNNEGERPISRPAANNEITWCFGTKSQSYTCSTARILGTALSK